MIFHCIYHNCAPWFMEITFPFRIEMSVRFWWLKAMSRWVCALLKNQLIVVPLLACNKKCSRNEKKTVPSSIKNTKLSFTFFCWCLRAIRCWSGRGERAAMTIFVFLSIYRRDCKTHSCSVINLCKSSWGRGKWNERKERTRSGARFDVTNKMLV